LCQWLQAVRTQAWHHFQHSHNSTGHVAQLQAKGVGLKVMQMFESKEKKKDRRYKA
jgi:hypothetical protein